MGEDHDLLVGQDILDHHGSALTADHAPVTGSTNNLETDGAECHD